MKLKVSVDVQLNEFGVYVITFEFTKKHILLMPKLKNSVKKDIQQIKQPKEKSVQKAKILEKRFIQKAKKLEQKSMKEIIKAPQKTSLNKVNKTKKTREEKQREKIQARFNKYSGNRIYGQYKSTGVFYPY